MSSWKKQTLTDVIDLIGGGTPKTSVSKYWDGDIPWISVKDFNNDNRYVYKTEKHISKYGLENSSTKMLQKDDIIISARGTVGEIAMIPYPMAFNQSCYGIRGKNGINQIFLYYLVKDRVKNLKSLTHGSVFDTITRDTFSNIEVTIPERSKQDSIAKILSIFDDMTDLNRRINDNLQKQIQIFYNKICIANFESVPMSTIVDVRDGTHDSPRAQSQGFSLITSKHLLPYGVDKTNANYISEIDLIKINERSKVDTNDILLSMIGTVGLVSLVIEKPVDFAIKNVALFKTSNRIELIYFLHCYLCSDAAKQNIARCLAGSTQKYISLGELRKMPVALPDQNIIQQFNSIVKPMYELITENVIQNKRLVTLRDTILPKLISGELDV